MPDTSNISLSVKKYDIGTYFTKVKDLTSTDIHDLIVNVYSPDKDFYFPKNKHGRKFRFDWLTNFEWLKYSPSFDGGFCLPCSLFSHCMPSKSKGLMISKPLLSNANALASFREHANVTYGIHAFSVESLKKFLENFKGNTKNDVDVMLESVRFEKANKFRKVPVPIVDCVFFCGGEVFHLEVKMIIALS